MVRKAPVQTALVAVLLAASPALAQDAAGAPAKIDLSRLPKAAEREVDFTSDVRPILGSRCLRCHSAKKAKGGLRLHAEAAARAGGDSGPVILPGDGAGSRLVHLVSGLDELVMPPGKSKRLSADEVAVLIAWIDQGARWGRAAAGDAAASGSEHWSFVPVARPEPPAVKETGRLRNPIDRFVLARLEKEGLRPGPEADRATLLRRLSLDLLGLLPAPDEVTSFVRDERPDAYERLVRRLLDSPHFGERWGRHWLDLARYADSDGYEKDNQRPWAWRYRDWVIDAINRDLPFDQFTREQLAGDLLPDATLEQRVATGFHRNTLTNTEGGTDQEEFRVKATVDRVNTTGSVWLGLTVGCGQCHSHKYDPLTQREYYGLFAFFNNADERNGAAPTPREVEDLERRRREFDGKKRELETSLAVYEKTRATDLAGWLDQAREVSGWKTLEILGAKSSGGARLDARDDGSVVVSGVSPDTDVYTVRASTTEHAVTGIRLEVLTEDSLPRKGPGRADNGNFVLSEIEVRVWKAGDARAGDGDGGRVVRIRRAGTDHAQKGFAVESAIDGKLEGGWAIAAGDGAGNRRRVATFELEEPVGFAEGTVFEVTMRQNHGGRHTIGRFRLGATTMDAALIHSPQRTLELLARPAAERSDADGKALARIYFSADVDWKKAREKLTELEKQAPKTSGTQARMLVERRGSRRKTHVLIRGDFLRKGAEVEATAPAVLHPHRKRGEHADRLDLAEWIIDSRNPLTARVVVNRWWQHLFGRGIVPSVDDFGVRGELPTHPALLDWLASELLELEWSRKKMIELIVTSRTYRQSSATRADIAERDTQNELLARQNRYRVEAEIVRDISLGVGGLLSERIGGPSVRPRLPSGVKELGYANSIKWSESKGEDRLRRGMYIFFQRTVPYPMLIAFDTPDSNVTCLERSRSNTPIQALTLLNDPVFFECAQALGARVLRDLPVSSTEDRVRHAFRLTVARTPGSGEIARVVTLFDELRALCEADPGAAWSIIGEQRVDGVAVEDLAAWVTIGRVLMNLDEFVSRG